MIAGDHALQLVAIAAIAFAAVLWQKLTQCRKPFSARHLETRSAAELGISAGKPATGPLNAGMRCINRIAGLDEMSKSPYGRLAGAACLAVMLSVPAYLRGAPQTVTLMRVGPRLPASPNHRGCPAGSPPQSALDLFHCYYPGGGASRLSPGRCRWRSAGAHVSIASPAGRCCRHSPP